jgi:uncharacterized membrane protein (GlpM family)
MQIILKITLSLAVILAATAIGKKFPSIGGLIAVMPLTGALVLIWIHIENRGHPEVMQTFTKAALWGMAPSILFFLTALVCYRKELPLPVVLISGFGAWAAGAVAHQWLLK